MTQEMAVYIRNRRPRISREEQKLKDIDKKRLLRYNKKMLVLTQNQTPKLTQEELKFCAKFMYSLLVDERIHNKTILIIEMRPMFHKEILEGLTIVLDEASHRPKKFRIVLNSNISKRRQLLALGHELVHVKQFTKGELGGTLEINNIRFTKWKKRLVNESESHYFDFAWEVEAHGKEYGLYKRYTNFLKKHKIKFKKRS